MTDDYTNWHPGNLIKDAAAQYRAAHRQNRRRSRLALPRSAAEQHAADTLSRTPCPAQPGFTHWIPPSMTECARGCGTTLTQAKEPTQ